MFAYEEHFIHCCKNINWYEDSFPYEKHFIHRCKNINWYEDSFAYEKHLIHRAVKTLIHMKIRLHMKDI